MTDEELEHRLTAVENRAQSNTHRLDELGKLTDAVNGMNTNIKLTIQQLENTNKSLEIVTAQNKKQEDRLTALEKAPGTFGNKLWWAVIAALVSGLVAYELTMLAMRPRVIGRFPQSAYTARPRPIPECPVSGPQL